MQILAVLPPREGFSPHAFGAVSLSVRDFALYSRFREDITVTGLIDTEPYSDVTYQCLTLDQRWYQRKQRAYLQAILQYISEHPPELIEVHNRPALALQLAGCTSIPVALHLHNDPQEMRKAQTARQRLELLRKMHIYCVSDWVKQRFKAGIGHAFAHKLFVTPCGIELPTLPTPKRQQIVYVGRMTPNKGVLEAVQALAAVLPEFPEWQASIIGGRRHSASERLSDYEQAVQQAAIPQIAIRGFQPYDVTQAAIAEAEIMLVPSKWDEPFGRTALEALAHGCAVITSGHGGLREVVDDHAVMCDVTSDAIAMALRQTLQDNALRRGLQKGAPQQAAKYAIAKCAAILDDARETIVAA
ncbi:MAG: hypothetical protein CMM93_05060 [Rickettsiales bacterium]|nr:hypothetical protein [Rickettsiales bacterium]|tara:strand:- start:7 stop:1080 length:1074 start_codon:yes stop_codon:yes gene_type:complete